MALVKNEVKVVLGIAGAIAVIVVIAILLKYSAPWYKDTTFLDVIIAVGLGGLLAALFAYIFRSPRK